MRIAISGAHRTGKTTLIEELAHSLRAHEVVDEPYYLLEEEGHECAETPSLEDFELQLERSIQCLLESGENRIFDRCPVDILAYLITHRDSEGFEVERWLPRVGKAMRKLDLIVFVSVEEPDRVGISDPEEAEWRRLVDEEIRAMVLDDPWELGVEVIEVTGSVRERARQVLAYVTDQSLP